MHICQNLNHFVFGNKISWFFQRIYSRIVTGKHKQKRYQWKSIHSVKISKLGEKSFIGFTFQRSQKKDIFV